VDGQDDLLVAIRPSQVIVIKDVYAQAPLRFSGTRE
jgi:hypothetical protein